MFTIFYVKFISEISTISPFKKAFFFKTNLIRRKNDLQGKPSTVPAVEGFFSQGHWLYSSFPFPESEFRICIIQFWVETGSTILKIHASLPVAAQFKGRL